jgi:hypothetical protein
MYVEYFFILSKIIIYNLNDKNKNTNFKLYKAVRAGFEPTRRDYEFSLSSPSRQEGMFANSTIEQYK